MLKRLNQRLGLRHILGLLKRFTLLLRTIAGLDISRLLTLYLAGLDRVYAWRKLRCCFYLRGVVVLGGLFDTGFNG